MDSEARRLESSPKPGELFASGALPPLYRPVADGKGDRRPGFLRDERGPEFAKLFDGLLSLGSAATTHTYRLDLSTSALEVRNDLGAFTPLPESDGELSPGAWALVIRLRHEWQPNFWREAGFVPLLRLRVADDGELAFDVYEDARGY